MAEAAWTNAAFQEDQKGKNGILFREEQVINRFKTNLEQRPVFEPKTFITILVAGDSGTIIDRPIREDDKEKYQQQWSKWLETKENVIPGTPIALWPVLSETQKAEFKALKIFTIEQFANLSDQAGLKVMGFNDLRKAAQRFVGSTLDTEILERAKAHSDAKIAEQALEIQQLRGLLEKVIADRASDPPAEVRAEKHPKKT